MKLVMGRYVKPAYHANRSDNEPAQGVRNHYEFTTSHNMLKKKASSR